MGTDDYLSAIIAIGTIVAMVLGVLGIFSLLIRKDQGFGPSSLKALGLVLFIPALILIAIQSPNFQSEALAALLGTVAGYVLSHSKSDSGS